MLKIKRVLLCLTFFLFAFLFLFVWHTFYYKEACWQDEPHLLCTNVTKNEVDQVITRSKENQVFVEGGIFLYGDVVNKTRLGSQAERSIVPIELTSYSISKYEVTRGDFIVFLRDTGAWSRYLPFKVDKYNDFTANNIKSSQFFHEKPVEPRKWTDAYDYCAWLADNTGLPFALPTEAQWEYAARSRGRDVYYATQREDYVINKDIYGGNRFRDWQVEQIRLGKVHPVNGDAFIGGHHQKRPVGSYPPNALGIHDMTGNVSEWTQDWYDPSYLSKLLARANNGEKIVDPSGSDFPLIEDDKPVLKRSIRDWAAHDGNGRLNESSAVLYARGGIHVNRRNVGFRCVVNQKTPLMPQREN